MHCTPRLLSLVSLIFSLAATGALALAVSTDFWLWTRELIVVDMQNMTMKMWIMAHSGLWRLCLVYEDDNFEVSVPASCNVMSFDQDWGRIEEAETTTSIMRAIRKAIPIVLLSLLILLVALGVSVVGNTKRDFKTIVGAVLFIFAALSVGGGVIVYISAVNDEVSHRKSAGPDGRKNFSYSYGWAFFFAGSAFVAALVAAVTNITLYLGKYSQLEDMALIIPGLEKHAESIVRPIHTTRTRRLSEVGHQNPTIVL